MWRCPWWWWTPSQVGSQRTFQRQQSGLALQPTGVACERSVRAQHPNAQREFQGAVPGRRYRIDIALEAEKIAIEIDGWQYHGKFKSAHESDRERQNHLAVAGWLVLRFTAGQIFKDLEGVSATIEKAVQQRRGQ